MSPRLKTKVTAKAAIAFASATLLMGGAAGAAARLSGTSSDVTVLTAKEESVIALLKVYPTTGKNVAAWATRLKSAEAGQSAAEATLNDSLQPAPTTTSSPDALLSVSGSGASSTQPFTVASSVKEWNVSWSYNCESFGQAGNFNYDVEQATSLACPMHGTMPSEVGKDAKMPIP